MQRLKIVSFIRKACFTLALACGIFAFGFYFGFKQDIEGMLASASAPKVSWNASGGYTAILSGRWIYVYDSMGALCDTVYVYTEYMTEEDKSALSKGMEFATEAEMEDFIDGFK